jgi:hypothetical protein
MSTQLSISGYLLCIQLLISLSGTVASAQIDAAKALIGSWDGWVEGIQGERGRTIVINSVKPKEGGGWVAQGRFGVTGFNLGRQTFDVSLQEGTVVVEFVTSAKNPGRLKLIGEDKLEGTLNFVVQRGSGDRSFKLEKVKAKAGDVK